MRPPLHLLALGRYGAHADGCLRWSQGFQRNENGFLRERGPRFDGYSRFVARRREDGAEGRLLAFMIAFFVGLIVLFAMR